MFSCRISKFPKRVRHVFSKDNPWFGKGKQRFSWTEGHPSRRVGHVF